MKTRKSRPGSHISSFTGLRGLAFLAVMAYHLYPNRFPGGYLGVVVFFALSGYLLMRNFLLGGEDQPLADLARRYIKLTRPLALVVGLVSIFSLIFFMPKVQGLGRAGLSSLLGLNNWAQLAESLSYFDLHGAYRPFTHLWSLSVEWQFYIVWAILMLKKGPKKARYRHVLTWSLLLSLVSILAMVILRALSDDPTRAYYGTDARFFSFGLGALAGALGTQGLRSLGQGGRDLHISMMMVPFLACLIFFSEGPLLYYGGMLVFTLLTCLILIYLAGDRGAWARFFSNPVLTYLGKRSYILYLWQYALMITFREVFAHSTWPPALQLAIQVLVLLVLAEASYRVLAQKSLRTRPLLAGSLVLSLVLILAQPLLPKADDLVPKTLAGEAEEAKVAKEETKADQEDQAVDPDTPNPLGLEAADLALIQELEGIMVGDSITEDSRPILKEVFPKMTIDGKINRQMVQAQEVIEGHDFAGDLIVLQMGTNSPFSKDAIYKLINNYPRAQVFLTNTVMPDPWEGEVNDLMAELAQEDPRIHLVDWYGLTKTQDELFYQDHTHPKPQGQEVLARLLAEELLAWARENK